jgi:hypothetical protein
LLKSRTQGASTTQFLWDPSSSPSRLLMQGSDKLIYGLGPLWVVKADGTTSAFARDGGKSVRAEVNGSGTVIASFRYRAWGHQPVLRRFNAVVPRLRRPTPRPLGPPIHAG